MRRIIKGIVALLCGLFSTACHTSKHGGVDLDVNGFAEMLKQTAEIQLVDVRTAEEFAAGHLRGALLIDFNAPNFTERAQALLKKKVPVAVYCRSGRRSAGAVERLRGVGFTKVYNLQGGFLDWLSEGQAYDK